MIVQLLQIALVLLPTAYLVARRRRIKLQNAASWESLIAQLRTDWSARDLCDQFLWKEEVTVTPEDAWKRMGGPQGLWAMFQNAGVMLQMANFADRNGGQVDRLTLETLRSDAMQIRLLVLMALVQYGFSRASEGVRVNAFRTASIYAAMSARMTALLQNHAATALPDFVAAM